MERCMSDAAERRGSASTAHQPSSSIAKAGSTAAAAAAPVFALALDARSKAMLYTCCQWQHQSQGEFQ